MELRTCVPFNSHSTACASFDSHRRVELKHMGNLDSLSGNVGMLTSSAVFAVIFMPIWMLCTSLHIPDVSMMFPSVTSSSVHNLVYPPGEYGAFESFWGFLTCLQVFFEPFA